VAIAKKCKTVHSWYVVFNAHMLKPTHMFNTQLFNFYNYSAITLIRWCCDTYIRQTCFGLMKSKTFFKGFNVFHKKLNIHYWWLRPPKLNLGGRWSKTSWISQKTSPFPSSMSHICNPVAWGLGHSNSLTISQHVHHLLKFRYSVQYMWTIPSLCLCKSLQ
jgi:hypothetical protein